MNNFGTDRPSKHDDMLVSGRMHDMEEHTMSRVPEYCLYADSRVGRHGEEYSSRLQIPDGCDNWFCTYSTSQR